MRRVVLVFVGGFCGTLARYLLSAPLLLLAGRVTPPSWHGGPVPYDVLTINLTGSLALGLLYGLFEHGARISPALRLTLGTGFLGAYTTFSSYVYGGSQLLARGEMTAGLFYLLASMACGVALARGGYLAARLVVRQMRERQPRGDYAPAYHSKHDPGYDEIDPEGEREPVH